MVCGINCGRRARLASVISEAIVLRAPIGLRALGRRLEPPGRVLVLADNIGHEQIVCLIRVPIPICKQHERIRLC